MVDEVAAKRPRRGDQCVQQLRDSETFISRPLRRVGNTDLRIPVLGLGCSPLGEVWNDVPPEQALQAIREAHKLGFTHFDTAPWYGNGMSEARVGMALNAIQSHGGAFTVSTKVGRTLEPLPRGRDGPWDGLWHGGFDLQVKYDYGYDAVMQQHRDSCLRMGLNKVDALAIHDLDAMFGGEDAVKKYLDQLRPPGGMLALQQLKERGIIKAVGIGCNPYKYGSLEVCKAVIDFGCLDYILLAGPYNLLNQEALDDLMPMCEKKSISVIVGAPFASGILAVGSRSGSRPTYMYEPATDAMLEKVKHIEGICETYKVPLSAAALQFPLLHPCVACVLSGVKSDAEVQQAAASINIKIPRKLWEDLRSEGLIRSDAPIGDIDPA